MEYGHFGVLRSPRGCCSDWIPASVSLHPLAERISKIERLGSRCQRLPRPFRGLAMTYWTVERAKVIQLGETGMRVEGALAPPPTVYFREGKYTRLLSKRDFPSGDRCLGRVCPPSPCPLPAIDRLIAKQSSPEGDSFLEEEAPAAPLLPDANISKMRIAEQVLEKRACGRKGRMLLPPTKISARARIYIYDLGDIARAQIAAWAEFARHPPAPFRRLIF